MSVLASNPAAHVASSGSASRLWTALTGHAVPLIFCAALWAIGHPYPGIVGDAHIYVGRALADLDPSGVGRDMLFVHDGQFGFSLFPLVMRALVARLGPGFAAEAISAAGCLCWFAAALALAAQVAKGRAMWLVLVFVCVLPHGYGHNLFVSAEALAVPRPFAEAAVRRGRRSRFACIAACRAPRAGDRVRAARLCGSPDHGLAWLCGDRSHVSAGLALYRRRRVDFHSLRRFRRRRSSAVRPVLHSDRSGM